MSSTLVADTGVVYAALDRRDRDHERCLRLLASGDVRIALASPVVVEVAWIASTRGHPDATDMVLGSIIDDSILVVDLDHEDYRRARDLLRTYADLSLDFVDAAVVAIAERLEEKTIATLDRRHFSAVRPLHCEAFTLVP